MGDGSGSIGGDRHWADRADRQQPRTQRRPRQRASCGHARPRRCDRARQCGTRCGSRAGRGSATRRSAGQATLPKRYRPRPQSGRWPEDGSGGGQGGGRPRRIGMATGVSERRVDRGEVGGHALEELGELGGVVFRERQRHTRERGPQISGRRHHFDTETLRRAPRGLRPTATHDQGSKGGLSNRSWGSRPAVAAGIGQPPRRRQHAATDTRLQPTPAHSRRGTHQRRASAGYAHRAQRTRHSRVTSEGTERGGRI